MARGRRLPPSMERLWLGELRRAHAIINIISIRPLRTAASVGYRCGAYRSGQAPRYTRV
jgi:hypothetical protein